MDRESGAGGCTGHFNGWGAHLAVSRSIHGISNASSLAVAEQIDCKGEPGGFVAEVSAFEVQLEALGGFLFVEEANLHVAEGVGAEMVASVVLVDFVCEVFDAIIALAEAVSANVEVDG